MAAVLTDMNTYWFIIFISLCVEDTCGCIWCIYLLMHVYTCACVHVHVEVNAWHWHLVWSFPTFQVKVSMNIELNNSVRLAEQWASETIIGCGYRCVLLHMALTWMLRVWTRVTKPVPQLTSSLSHLSSNFISICDMKSDVNSLVMRTVTIWVAWWRLYYSYYGFSTWQTTKWRKVPWLTVSGISRTRRLGRVSSSHCGNSCCMQMLLPSSCPVKAETWLRLDQL